MGGISAGSIIWPMLPSVSTTTIERYFSARSKARTVRSIDSCTDGGRQNDQVVIAVTAAVDHLVVISLGRWNVAKTGSAAHHIHQNSRHFRAGDIGNPSIIRLMPGLEEEVITRCRCRQRRRPY